ncbi:hypothetical protein [Paraliomyxa miuraensis]|uniref:hypothetical protein n=1 Tax=Paraliomyxa miuraensis TaxID=376150 RepID=UPI0022563223|nr:hypothetical protein [Paraliomyxa miuraensis]MCX4246141.1 hypothetical protein [Paraliomyxa miuraensis]
MRTSKILPAKLSAVLTIGGLVLASTGCFDGDASSGPPQRAMPRKADPELTHSWQVPPDKSVLGGADLGSDPPALADALMSSGAAPSITHRISLACAEKGALAHTATVALRLSIAEGGTVTSLEGDPAGAAATCIADAFREELAKLYPLPAGAALLVLRFHPRQGG